MTDTPSLTASATATPSQSPTHSFTWTPTASESFTPSPSFTITETFTFSPTPGPSATNTPISTTQVVLEVLDQNFNVVALVRAYASAGQVSAIFLSQQTYVPETQGLLVVTDNFGVGSSWNGTGSNGQTPLPNGQYWMRSTHNGLAVDQGFRIEHADWNGGSIAVLGSPAKQGADAALRYSFSQPVYFHARVHNLAGELVSQYSEVGVSGNIQLRLRTPSGQPVSTGVYLIQIRAETVSGGLEFEKVVKVAVIR